MAEVERRYVGIGIRHYDDDMFEELPRAVEDVRDLGEHLKDQRDFRVEIIEDPTEEQVRSALKGHLKTDSLAPGSALVILWSGHGEEVPEGLHLIAKNTVPRSAPELTPNHLASLVARRASSDSRLSADELQMLLGGFDPDDDLPDDG